MSLSKFAKEFAREIVDAVLQSLEHAVDDIVVEYEIRRESVERLVQWFKRKETAQTPEDDPFAIVEKIVTKLGDFVDMSFESLDVKWCMADHYRKSLLEWMAKEESKGRPGHPIPQRVKQKLAQKALYACSWSFRKAKS